MHGTLIRIEPSGAARLFELDGDWREPAAAASAPSGPQCFRSWLPVISQRMRRGWALGGFAKASSRVSFRRLELVLRLRLEVAGVVPLVELG